MRCVCCAFVRVRARGLECERVSGVGGDVRRGFVVGANAFDVLVLAVVTELAGSVLQKVVADVGLVVLLLGEELFHHLVELVELVVLSLGVGGQGLDVFLRARLLFHDPLATAGTVELDVGVGSGDLGEDVVDGELVGR